MDDDASLSLLLAVAAFGLITTGVKHVVTLGLTFVVFAVTCAFYALWVDHHSDVARFEMALVTAIAIGNVVLAFY
ncbi:hypothetical protein SPRG_15802 [Saprolegnia parasitica CBS 223.65]|uniref:Uncharacterized protein n=1 Tax=Saprolegnia parasitica (strain CBS 223.65) TaxID=695850 RepID=A0A067BWG0_SAPPC|nr:hypothetical protein SPRG_15802 [Saprolegnia parasitica CBS 223.65]KDO18947.1 hypothetical protein SPRG_15802 [Saprolegnia parasitica CBS 223.65]|eukprot:XP_012210360.1 hypothetical protein SPRG_15802 [Saprolegnia parasitica CBS 223.65]